jgi:hypothetical protein
VLLFVRDYVFLGKVQHTPRVIYVYIVRVHTCIIFPSMYVSRNAFFPCRKGILHRLCVFVNVMIIPYRHQHLHNYVINVYSLYTFPCIY